MVQNEGAGSPEEEDTMKETFRLAAEIAKAMSTYKISEKDMQELIDAHDGNAKAASRTLEGTGQMSKRMN